LGRQLWAGAGGLIGHLARGMSRSDMKDLGDALDDGQAALIVIGESKVGEKLDKDLSRAQKSVENRIDAYRKEVEKELHQAEAQAV
jgi:hypothetical protein